MASDELLKSWKRTEAFLRDARSHLSEAAEGICGDEIHAFDEYLQHNELELALDMLEEALEKSGFETWRVLEFMGMAAATTDQSVQNRKANSGVRGRTLAGNSPRSASSRRINNSNGWCGAGSPLARSTFNLARRASHCSGIDIVSNLLNRWRP